MPNLPHVSQVIIDRWDRLNPAQQQYFIDYNAKQAAKADAKAADNAAKAAVRVEARRYGNPSGEFRQASVQVAGR